jgi:hypothetical protein
MDILPMTPFRPILQTLLGTLRTLIGYAGLAVNEFLDLL